MSAPLLRRLTSDEFYDWVEGREGRYDLVDGVPDATVALPTLDLALPLAELYRGVTFHPRPILVDSVTLEPPA